MSIAQKLYDKLISNFSQDEIKEIVKSAGADPENVIPQKAKKPEAARESVQYFKRHGQLEEFGKEALNAARRKGNA